MNGPSGLVVGTAGHIDHGKTSLVRALTGIDTDRLPDEKRRGISIDLGFAHLTLPNGQRISFIDVPGHERFIKNMLAGVGGIQAVLLVVAADESVKPQTREHFDICRLLGIKQGIIVLTKTDLATSEQIGVTREDVRGLCAGSFLDGAPVIPVSAKTGEGIAELRNQLAKLIESSAPREYGGLARLPIDRSFALKGFGTVVTGTLWAGKLHTGDTVQVHPSNKQARIRGLQVHGEQVDVARAGQRTAVNLTGIDSSEVRRGCVLTHANGLATTTVLDVSLDWLNASEIPKARQQVLFHIGTAEVVAELKVFDTFARLSLSEPVLALPGDRFVLRRPSPAQTISGGTVIDAFPPARLNRARTIQRLELLADADPAARIQILVDESAMGSTVAELVRVTGITPDDLRLLILKNPALVLGDAAQRVVTTAWVERKRKKLLDWLTAFHSSNPSAAGAPVAIARLGLDPNLATVVFDAFPLIRVQGALVSLAAHQPKTSDNDTQSLLNLERLFRQAGFQPPSMADALKSASPDPKKARGLLEALIKNQKLVRVSEDLVFHADVIAAVRKSLSARKGRRFSVPEFKEWTQVSRKYAIPLLEYLDRQHVTRREGDFRIVL